MTSIINSNDMHIIDGGDSITMHSDVSTLQH